MLYQTAIAFARFIDRLSVYIPSLSQVCVCLLQLLLKV